ncbi:tRNA glutamyl-Q(34) synthetase GluQRS [Alicyclobacillus acidiphilus]|uniref:tRNA glutamyl-Q(34) synthetase GluQRS n=1 Tax=Alicyclobacillus acidiphilus TaxID=182455 RepID=UPI000836CBFC|nr:tRNA glutamyl-Q(34) synthetase GluQRS [Alicyclobacillus acidiphilus]
MRRGRFAPTPSGQLHLGNALTALLAWLHMRAVGGQLILRVEDIDVARCRTEYALQMMDELRWLGLDWDEGPDVGGPCGPYEQSRRTSLYEEAIRILEQAGRLYPCFCSRAELLQVASAPHNVLGEPRYPGTCRALTDVERMARRRAKEPSLRFRVDDQAVASFVDLVYGQQRVPLSDVGDFVVRRADGLFAYQLAVVVDDAAMGVTDVLRGADLLSSTPRQLTIYQAFGWPEPTFVHVPLVVDRDGQKLSKRDRSITLAYLRSSGVPASRVVGVLAFLAGLCDKPVELSPGELISRFDVKRLPNQPIRLTEECESMLAMR